MAQEEELIIEPAFFAALRQHFPQISDVHVLLKRGRYQNEMTQFRYDVILRLGESQPSKVEPVTLNWQDEKLTPTALSRFLTETRPEVLTLTSIPNSRVFPAVKALELLAGEQRPETVDDLRQLMGQALNGDSIDPEEVAALSGEVPYGISMGWTNPNTDACFDIVCQRRNGDDNLMSLRPSLASTNGRPASWAKYANDPLEGRFTRNLVPKLRSLLQEQLPEYMVPSAFVLMNSMPLTPHGKINRKALPDPEQARPELADIYIAPRTQTEKDLAGMFAHILGVTQVGLHDNFFELGGHSLLATQLLSRIREGFPEKEIPLHHIFEFPTVAGLARAIEARAETDQDLRLPPLVSIPRDGELPLSLAQQRLWFLDQLEPGSTVYNSPAAVRFTGALNSVALEQAFNEVVRRHEVLRTSFSIRAGNPVQIIASSLQVPLPIIDLSELPAAMVEDEIQRLSRLEARQAFNLRHGALLRTKLLRVSAEEHVVLLSLHHIISDGWSIGVLIREVAALYSAYMRGEESPLEKLPVQYADFAQWQRTWLQGQVLAAQLDYWRAELAGAPAVLNLPLDRPRLPATGRHRATHPFEIPVGVMDALKQLGHERDATLFMVLHAAFLSLLHYHTGEVDIVIGTDVANRHKVELEGLIGFFVNQLVLRVDVSGDPAFPELLARVRKVDLGAYAHQHPPFDAVVEALNPERSMLHSPLFQVKLLLQNTPLPQVELAGLTLDLFEIEPATAKFDLLFSLREDVTGLQCQVEYNSDIFDATTITRMAAGFVKIAGHIAEHPTAGLSEIAKLLADFDMEQQSMLQARLEGMRRQKLKNLVPKPIVS